MQPPQNEWPETDNARHLLFIAQTMRQMLTSTTFESFRLQALDVLSRFREAIRVIGQIEGEKIHHLAAVGVIDELMHSIQQDPVAMEILGGRSRGFFDSAKPASYADPKFRRRISNQLEVMLHDLEISYRSAIENKLISSSLNRNEKDLARNVCHSYLAYLRNRGHNKQYILLSVNEIFFAKNIIRADARLIKRFIARFHDQKKEYKVYIPLSKQASTFFRKSGVTSLLPITLDHAPKAVRDVVLSSSEFSQLDDLLEMKANSDDPFDAVDTVQRVVNIYSAVSILEERGFDLLTRPYAFVTASSGGVKVFRKEHADLQRMSASIPQARAQRVKDFAGAIINDFPRESWERILSAMENSSLARLSSNPENQLTLVWSSIEAFFGDPPKGMSRIGFYVDSITPCLCLNYPWRYAKAVHAQLVSHHRRSLETTLRELGFPSENSTLDHFLQFVFDARFKKEHGRLLSRLSHNPLALNMLHSLYERFKNPSSYARSVGRHEQRIKWQVARIYRARNDIVHSGRTSSFIRPLAANAFEYFRTATQSVLYKSSKVHFKNDTPFFVAMIEMDYESRSRSLKDMAALGANFDPQAFLRMFDRV